MKLPDANLLLALDILLSEKSVVNAAKHMNLSTSAMSRTLTRLRKVTGDPLLVRAGRKMVLTPYADSIKDRTHLSVLEVLDLLQPNVRALDLTSLNRVFTIRANDGFTDTFAPMLITQTIKEASQARLSFLPKPVKSPDGLREGKVDLEIGVVSNMGPEIRTKAIFYDRFVGIVHKDHPLAQFDTITPEQYSQFDHVIASRRGQFSGPVDDELELLGLSRNIVATVPSFPAALSVAKHSNLVALVPESFLLNQKTYGTENSNVSAFALPVKTDGITISMMWHPRQQNDSAHIWFRNLVMKVCQEAISNK